MPTIKQFEKQLAKLDRLKDKAKLSADKADADAKAVREFEWDLFYAMREAGITSVTTADRRYTTSSTTRGNVTDANAFREWAEAEGLLSEFYTPNVRKQRINEEVRHRQQTGQELPPGLSSYTTDYISRTAK